MTEPDEPPYGHEPPSIADRLIIRIGVVLTVLIVAVALAIHAVLLRVAPHHARVVARPAAIPPAPRLEVHPHTDLAAFNAAKVSQLEGWSWTDASHAFARIPIERAMVIYARQQADKPAPQRGAAP